MKKEIRTIVYDEDLKLEAYLLEGIVQPFPNHFHDHYVLGFMEGGARCMTCKNQEYLLGRGDIILFHPEENHACCQAGEESLDYRAFNIPKETMASLSKEIMGLQQLPGFRYTVFHDEEISCYLHTLHTMVMKGSTGFDKEEQLFLLMNELLQNYSQPFAELLPECSKEVTLACAFMEAHYKERIRLDTLCTVSNLSKSTLLRAFTRVKGITPYRYLETIRVNEAKKLLELGHSPMEAALMTGFSDQSHFTNYFTSYTGITPATYREIFQGKEKTYAN